MFKIPIPTAAIDKRYPTIVRQEDCADGLVADDRCVVQIFSTGKADISLWYRMWEAVTAVFNMCVRLGEGGSFLGLGRWNPPRIKRRSP